MKLLAGRRPSPAFLIGCLALLVALADQADALPGINSVMSNDIAPGAVKRSDVAANAINGAKVADGSLSGVDIGGAIAPAGPAAGDLTDQNGSASCTENAVRSGQIINGAGRAPHVGRITT